MHNFSTGDVTGGFEGAGFNFIGKLMSKAGENVCPTSEDHLHHGDPNRGGSRNGFGVTFSCTCDYCGQVFYVTKSASDLSAAYDTYVNTLPSSGYNSAGHLIWKVSLSDFADGFTVGNLIHYANSPVILTVESPSGIMSGYIPVSFVDNYTVESSYSYPSGSGKLTSCVVYGMISAPLSGFYRLLETPVFSCSYMSDTAESGVCSFSYKEAKSGTHYSSSTPFKLNFNGSINPNIFPVHFNAHWYLPVYEVIPDSSAGVDYGDTYNTNSRPTSITGGALGIADVDANGQLTGTYTKIDDHSTSDDHSSIVNETNNTYWNPVTNTTVPITNWSYDYSDRSYRVDYTATNTTGDTVTNTSTVTYGDEYITIQEIDNSKGDTITNNYTIYYLVDGSGSETPVDPPGPCEHSWAETSTTPATCTMPGSKLLTCSKCQQTQTQSLPVLGHDWQVKQSVNTEYDETGQLVQQGYTIYECSRCHEQYKTDSGTSPPVNPSDPDVSGDGVFSGIFGLLLDFLGFFWKTFRDFTKSGVRAFLKALQDGSNDIFGLLNPFDWSA